MADYAGGCHCGNVRYVYVSSQAPEAWSVRRCTCTHCVRFGARYTSGPGTRLDVTVLYASLAQHYEFGTRTAQFLRCGKCGVMVLAASETDGRRIAVLNVNTLDDCETMDFVVTTGDFDAEDREGRLARRARNWIRDVSIRYVNA